MTARFFLGKEKNILESSLVSAFTITSSIFSTCLTGKMVIQDITKSITNFIKKNTEIYIELYDTDTKVIYKSYSFYISFYRKYPTSDPSSIDEIEIHMKSLWCLQSTTSSGAYYGSVSSLMETACKEDSAITLARSFDDSSDTPYTRYRIYKSTYEWITYLSSFAVKETSPMFVYENIAGVLELKSLSSMKTLYIQYVITPYNSYAIKTSKKIIPLLTVSYEGSDVDSASSYNYHMQTKHIQYTDTAFKSLLESTPESTYVDTLSGTSHIFYDWDIPTQDANSLALHDSSKKGLLQFTTLAVSSDISSLSVDVGQPIQLVLPYAVNQLEEKLYIISTIDYIFDTNAVYGRFTLSPM